jgi:hypothetical protein
MKNYTTEELQLIDAKLRIKFEALTSVFCAEIPHDFNRDQNGFYTDEGVMGLWAGYILNYMAIYHTAAGVRIVMRPSLLEELKDVSLEPIGEVQACAM